MTEKQAPGNEKRKWGPLPKNPYEALGVSPNATKDEIRSAWKKMSRKYHPDVNPENKQEAHEWVQVINEAKDILLKPGFKGTHFKGWSPSSGSTYRPRTKAEETYYQQEEARRQREAADRQQRREAADRANQRAEQARQAEENARQAAEAERARQEEETRQREAEAERARQAGEDARQASERARTQQETEANDKAREEYFQQKNKKRPKEGTPEATTYDADLKTKEEAYRATKRKIVESFLTEGEVGKAKAQEFLLKEVELKRANDVNNLSNFGWERNKVRISDTIEQWDKWGVEQKDSSGKVIKEGSAAARLTKMGISLVMIGAVSSFGVQKAAEYGWGTASAAGAGRLVQRLALGVGVAGFMEKTSLSPGKKRALQLAMLAGGGVFAVASGTGLAGLGAIAGASAVGYIASRFTRKYEGKMAGRMKDVKDNNQINLSTLDADTEKIEKAMEEALKRAENTRLVGKIAEVAAALAGSATTLELMGHMQDDAALKTQSEADAQALKDANAQHEADLKALADAKATATTPLDAQAQAPLATTPTPDATQSAPAGTEPTAPLFDSELDVVHKGEGIEHVFRRQIEHDPALAEKLGYDGDPTDARALHQFSGGAADRLALDQGYVDKVTGEEIRVGPADELAYKIKLDNGELKVDEIRVHGGFQEQHEAGASFEEDQKDSYEYKDFARHEPTHPIPDAATPEPISTTEPAGIQEPMVNEEQLSRLKEMGFTGDPKDRGAVEEFFRNEALKHFEAESEPGPNIESDTVPQLETKPMLYGRTIGVAGNPFHLEPEVLNQVDKVYTDNLMKIFPDNNRVWQTVSEIKAHTVLENIDTYNSDTPMGAVSSYLHKLQDITGLKPQGRWLFGKENTGHYIARALQKAADMEQLDNVKLK